MKFLLINQETYRLKFRQLEDSDFANWLELFKDDETVQLLGMTQYKSPQERCEKWFEWTFVSHTPKAQHRVLRNETLAELKTATSFPDFIFNFTQPSETPHQLPVNNLKSKNFLETIFSGQF